MLKFSITLPIIFSALFILLSQAGLKLPTCALSCASTAGNQAGCNITDKNCICHSAEFIAVLGACVLVECDGDELEDGLAAIYLADFCL